jgi:hypothetical protein
VQFWDARGGVRSWCDVAKTAAKQQAAYPWVKISIISLEAHTEGEIAWRIRLTPDLQIVLWKAVPADQEQLFRDAVAYYRSACGL